MDYTVYKSDKNKLRQIAALFSSEARLEIYLMLRKETLSVTDISKRIGLSIPTTSNHIGKMQATELIKVEYVNDGTNKKLCSAKYDKVILNFTDIKKAKKMI